MGTGSRVYSFLRAVPSSTDVPVLLLNQPKVRLQVAGEFDLISAGASLHSFQRSTEKTQSPARSETDLHLSGCAISYSMQRRKVKLLNRHTPGRGILLCQKGQRLNGDDKQRVIHSLTSCSIGRGRSFVIFLSFVGMFKELSL